MCLLIIGPVAMVIMTGFLFVYRFLGFLKTNILPILKFNF